MKISFIIPNQGVFLENKNWLWWIYLELKKKVEVLLNEWSADCDFIVGMSDSLTDEIQRAHTQALNVPLVVYNWDYFSFQDKTTSQWQNFIRLMREAKEVWTCSKDTAKLCERELGIPHYVIYCPALDFEFKGKKKDDGYVVIAQSRRPHKGWKIVEQASKELNFPFTFCQSDKYPRKQFIEIMKNCSIVVVPTTEESNATMNSIEGAFCKKPLLLSDIEANKECWGDCAFYFKSGDVEDFKKQLKWLWKNRKSEKVKKVVRAAYQKANLEYTPEVMANEIIKRLNGLGKI